MNRFSKNIIDFVVKTLVGRLTVHQIKEVLNNILTFIEGRIKDSDSTFDDSLLPVIKKLRDAIGILDIEEDQLDLPIGKGK